MNILDSKKAELRRKKRVIYNDDGAGISLYDGAYGTPITEMSFIKFTIGAHRGVGNHLVPSPTRSDVTTFVFEVGGAGATLYSSNIPNMHLGGYLGVKFPAAAVGDASEEIIAQTGKDALQIASEFCDANDMEFFYGIRINDRHGASSPRDELVPIKQELWDNGGLLLNGVNSGLDYSSTQVRNLMRDTILEVVNDPKYKINGVCINLGRHYGLFPNVVVPSERNKRTTQAQIDIMTDWMVSIKQVMDARSLSLIAEGKPPLLLMIKAADSPEFNKELGLDLDEWMRLGLVDILVPNTYHQFNPLKEGVLWGKQYGVSVCPSLQDSRLTDKRKRLTEAGLVGRVCQILDSGSDGIEIFNYNYGRDTHYRGPSGRFWRELTQQKAKATAKRIYYPCFTTQAYTDIGTAGKLPLPVYIPHTYATVGTDIYWQDFESVDMDIYEPNASSIVLRIYSDRDVGEVSFNGMPYTGVFSSGENTVQIDTSNLISGENKIEIASGFKGVDEIELEIS